MTPEEIKSTYYNYCNISVHHNNSTFKGTYFCDSYKNFNTTFGNNLSKTNTAFDKDTDLLIGFKSFLSSDQKHHNMQFIIAKEIPL